MIITMVVGHCCLRNRTNFSTRGYMDFNSRVHPPLILILFDPYPRLGRYCLRTQSPWQPNNLNLSTRPDTNISSRPETADTRRDCDTQTGIPL